MFPLAFIKLNKQLLLIPAKFQKPLHKWACLGWRLEVEVFLKTRLKIERLCKTEEAPLLQSKFKNAIFKRKQGKTHLGRDYKPTKFPQKRVNLVI